MSSSPVDPRDGAAGPPAVQPRWADAPTAAALTRALHAWPSHVLTATQAAALLRLLDGVYTPLAGFMTAAQAARAAGAEALDDGSWWPVPVILDVLPATAERLAMGGPLVLREPEGRAVAVMPDGQAWQDASGWRVGGAVVGLQAPPVYDLIDLRLSPTEVRDEIARRGWRMAIAVPVDRVLHRADVAALDALAAAHDAGLVILAVTRAGVIADRDRYARLRALRAAVAHLAPGRGLLVLDTRPDAEGAPGSAIDAVLARAFGCARVVAWDGAGDALTAAAGRGGVAVDVVASAPPVPGGRQRPTARDAWTFPEVAAELDRQAPPAWARGVTVFFTGLSGSGKSTIANALRVRLLEDGRRTVTLLDGDLVRTHLSSELGFSREHRNAERPAHRLRRGRDHTPRRRRHLRADRAVRGSPPRGAGPRRGGGYLPAGLRRDADRRVRGARSEGAVSAGPGGHAAGVHRHLRSLRRSATMPTSRSTRAR